MLTVELTLIMLFFQLDMDN